MDAYLVHYGVKGMRKGVRRTSITYTGESEPIRKRETRAKRKIDGIITVLEVLRIAIDLLEDVL